MARKDELLRSIAQEKAEKKYDCLYLAVVNIVLLRSQLLMVGESESSLAIASFKEPGYSHPSDAHPNVLDLGNLVSRKKDFIPVITRAVKNGWSPSISTSKSEVTIIEGTIL